MTRDTGHRVTLPLVWEGDRLLLGPFYCGTVRQIQGWDHEWGVELGEWAPTINVKRHHGYHPTRAAAEAAVEAAVMAALGERREG